MIANRFLRMRLPGTVQKVVDALSHLISKTAFEGDGTMSSISHARRLGIRGAP